MVRQSFAVAVATIALLCSLIATPAEARREWQAFGGNGDTTSKIECPAGDVMVGVEGNGSTNITKLGLICAPLLDKFSTGVPHNYGGFIGSDRFVPLQASCPNDSIMTALRFRLTRDKGHVITIQLDCTNEYGATTVSSASALDLALEDGFRSQSCPNEQFVGLTLHYGRDVNAIGAICDRRDVERAAPPPAAEAPPPPPPEPAFRTTGRRGAASAPMATFFAQPWNMVVTPGTPFRLVFHEDEGPGALWGEMLFADTKLNGTVIGKLSEDGREFTFTYEQPQIGVSGHGSLKIYTSRVMGGHVTTDQDGQSIQWAGRN